MSTPGFRISPQQKQLWRNGPDQGRTVALIAIRGGLDPQALETDLQAMVERHEILRTDFRCPANSTLPLQHISEDGRVDFEVLDLVDQSEEARERLTAGIMATPILPMDAAPWLRARLLRCGDEDWRLVLELAALRGDAKAMIGLVNELLDPEAVAPEEADDEEEEGAVQYADVCEILNEMLDSEETKAGRDFWEQQTLEPGPIHGRYPAGGPSQKTFALEGLDPSDPQLESFLCACWLVLARLGGKTAPTIGLGRDGRSYEELAEAQGLFSRYVPLHPKTVATQSFAALREEVHAFFATAEEYQDYFMFPEEGAETWFPVTFDCRHLPTPRTVNALTFEVVDLVSCYDRSQLNMTCTLSSKGVTVRLSAETYGEAGLARLADRFQALVKAARSRPTDPIGAFSCVGREETRLMQEVFNDTQWSVPDLHICHMIEARVNASPGASALVAGEQTMTYEALDIRANQLAHLLRARGMGPEKKVAVCFERSFDLVVSLLGVLKTGACFLPLDPSYPSDRLLFMQADARVDLLLTDEANRGVGGDVAEHLVFETLDLNGFDTAHPMVSRDLQSAAYIIYTSGSTGAPKGAVISHAGLTNYLIWAAETYPGAAGGAPLHSPIGFDLTITSLFVPLVAGREIRLLAGAPGRETLDRLREDMAAGGNGGFIKMTPAHLVALAQLVPAEKAAGSADTFILGGEALDFADVQFWRTHHPALRVINEYGPTETVVGCCVYDLPEVTPEHGPVPIGKPIANTRLYVLDPNFNQVALGLPGEVYIGGAGVARGYLHRPGLTASRFVPDPFSKEPGARLYRTGDLAYFAEDLNLVYRGRMDNQVKIRGNRVELGEIETVIRQSGLVKEAVVLIRETLGGESGLVAYLVCDAARESALVDHLKARVPEYMVPSHFLFLAQMPLTDNAKVDRKALAAMPLNRAGSTNKPPGSPIEEVLLLMWRDVLKLERFGVEDNFFELGGHSLLLVRIHTRILAVFQLDLGINQLFDAFSIEKMAALLVAEEDKPGESMTIAKMMLELIQTPDAEKDALVSQAGLDPEQEENAAFGPVGGRELCLLRQHLEAGGYELHRATRILPRGADSENPLSFAQQRLWFLDQLEGGASSTYNNPWAMKIHGPLDLAVLARCLSEVEARHEVLRTTYPARVGEPYQEIHPARERSLEVTDLTHLAGESREEELIGLIVAEASRPFDLAAGPVWRTAVMKLADQEYALVMTMHHICSDGWSVPLLIGEICALYRHHVEGVAADLPVLPIQYADYAAWQRNWLQGEVLERQIGYWRHKLAGTEQLPALKTDHPRPNRQTYVGAMARLALSAELSQSLRDLSHKRDATLFMTLLTAYYLMIRCYEDAARDDLVLGTDLANRNHEEVESLIGFFVNQLVLRTDFSGDPTLEEAVGRVRTTALEGYAHAELPFEQVVKAMGQENTLGQSPFFQAKMFLEHASDPDIAVGGITLSHVEIPSNTSRLDLTLGLWDNPESGISGWFNYNTDLFELTTIKRMVWLFQRILEIMAAEPEKRVSQLDEQLLQEEKAQQEAARKSRREEKMKRFQKGKRKSRS